MSSMKVSVKKKNKVIKPAFERRDATLSSVCKFSWSKYALKTEADTHNMINVKINQTAR